jgi:hypothetical protein
MLLEKQELSTDDFESQVEALARELPPRDLWDEP